MADPEAMEYQLKKYLLLLATLVATVTYAAGLNPPGGSWLEDSPSPGGRRIAGDSILREINFRRYIVFYCFNAIAFAASLLLSLLLLFLHKDGGNTNLLLMLAVMLVDGLGLTGDYAGGGSHDRFTTVCAAGWCPASRSTPSWPSSLTLRATLLVGRRRGLLLPASSGRSTRSCWCSPSSRRPSRTRPG